MAKLIALPGDLAVATPPLQKPIGPLQPDLVALGKIKAAAYWVKESGSAFNGLKDLMPGKHHGVYNNNAEAKTYPNFGRVSTFADQNIDAVQVTHNSILNASANFSFSFWMYLTGNLETYASPVGMSNANWSNGYAFYYNASNLYFWTDHWDTYDASISFSGSDTGRWVHVVGTVGDGQNQIYVDGVAGTSETSSIQDTTNDLVFGSFDTYGIVGAVDNVLICHSTLTPSQIKAIYRHPFQYVRSVNDVPFLFSVAAPAASIAPQHFHHRHISRAG